MGVIMVEDIGNSRSQRNGPSEPQPDILDSRSTAIEPGTLGEHPDDETLRLLRSGHLPHDREQRVLGHLGQCSTCADRLLFYAAGEEDSEGVERDDLEEAWRRMKTDRDFPGARWPSARLCLELFGLVLLVFLAVEWRERESSQALLSAPSSYVDIVDLAANAPVDPESPVRHRTPLDLSPTNPVALTVLAVEPGFGNYQVQILDARQREIWRADPLDVDSQGIATLKLSQGFLEDGRYDIMVTAFDGDAIAAHWSFPIEIRPGA